MPNPDNLTPGNLCAFLQELLNLPAAARTLQPSICSKGRVPCADVLNEIRGVNLTLDFLLEAIAHKLKF